MKTDRRKEYNLKQLIIEIPEELHTRIKVHAHKRNISMKSWIVRYIIKGLAEEFRK